MQILNLFPVEKDTFDHYGDMIRRDKRRWARADSDNDGMLTKEEFTDYLHPEQSERMKDVVIDVSFSVYFCVAGYLKCTLSPFSKC